MQAAAATTVLRAVSPPRIAGWSSALAVHAVAFALLALPPRPLLPEVRQETPRPLLADIVRTVVPKTEPVPPIPTPPRREPKPRETPPVPVTTVLLAESALPVPVAVATPRPALEAFGEPATPVLSQGAQIAYDHAPPPPYPSLARRRGWEGDVLLRVRVGADGRPREVVVERSSGRRMLDQAASEHVLAKWRFQPALEDGRQVDAWARVPISFRIERF